MPASPDIKDELVPCLPSRVPVGSEGRYTAEAFFGRQQFDFSVVSMVAGVPDQTRDYERFTDVVEDTIDARMYLGIHFRAPDVQGAGIGRDVANWLEQHFFEPVG